MNNENQQKPNKDSGFKVTHVKLEQLYKGTYNFNTKKAKVDKESKTETLVDYLIKISEKEILITTNEGKEFEKYIINHKEKKDVGVIVYDTKNSNGIRFLVSHLVNDEGNYSYFEFRSSDKLKFYVTTD